MFGYLILKFGHSEKHTEFENNFILNLLFISDSLPKKGVAQTISMNVLYQIHTLQMYMVNLW